MVREVVTNPLEQEVLDPACGSGTFVAEAVTHFIEAAENEPLGAEDVLEWLRFSIAGIDVHPVAVHLARAAWVLAARPAIQAAQDAGYSGAVSAPVYLGDALQMRFRSGDMFAEREVTIDVEDDQNSQLVYPLRLVNEAEIFDPLMGDIADCVERGQDPALALDDHGITDPGERETLKATIATLQRLHDEGRDHIWAYYTRNLVRPVALARRKVDVISRQSALAQLQQHGQHAAPGARKPQQEPIRHLGWRPVRHAPGRGRAVLRPLRGPVSQARRRR